MIPACPGVSPHDRRGSGVTAAGGPGAGRTGLGACGWAEVTNGTSARDDMPQPLDDPPPDNRLSNVDWPGSLQPGRRRRLA
jgi:hypothetical protein